MATMNQHVYDISGLTKGNLRTALFMPYRGYWMKITPNSSSRSHLGRELSYTTICSPGLPPQAEELRFRKYREDLHIDIGQPCSFSLLGIFEATSKAEFLDKLPVEPGLIG